jgi:hypothetical protein
VIELYVGRRRVAEEWETRPAAEREANVYEPTRVIDIDTGVTVAIVAAFPGEIGAYRRALISYPSSTTLRATGIRNVSRVFGFTARAPVMQRQGCRTCSGAYEAPLAHTIIVKTAADLASQLHGLLEGVPDQIARAREVIRPQWFLSAESWWTSGVVNRTSPLPYHRDGNNVPRCWSAMPVVRRHTRGGHLHIPEYDLTLACRDGQVVYFDGHDLLHGVTPIRKLRPDAYRITAVYYTIATMRHCLDADAELERSRASRTSAEDDQIERQRAAGYLE